MDKKMEQMISRDLGVEINEIRKLSWNQLEKNTNDRRYHDRTAKHI